MAADRRVAPPPRGRLGRRLLLVALAVGLAAAALVGLANWRVLRASRGRLHEDVAGLPARPWAIIPGARVKADGTPSAALLDRLTAALEAHRGGRVERILVSGDGLHGDQPGVMARWLVAHGVPPGAIEQDAEGFRTRATMARARRRFGVQRAVVCTQRFHLPRAIAWARHEGIDAVGLVADRRAYPHQRYDDVREALARTLAWLEML